MPFEMVSNVVEKLKGFAIISSPEADQLLNGEQGVVSAKDSSKVDGVELWGIQNPGMGHEWSHSRTRD